MTEKLFNFFGNDYEHFSRLRKVVNRTVLNNRLDGGFSSGDYSLKELLKTDFSDRLHNLEQVLADIASNDPPKGKELKITIHGLLKQKGWNVEHPYFGFISSDIPEKYREHEYQEIVLFLKDIKNRMGDSFPDELENFLKKEEAHIEDRSNLERLLGVLKEHGIHRIKENLNSGASALVSGASALVLETNDNQIVRIIRAKTKEIQSLPPTVLQPLYTIDVDDFCIQIMPKVHTLQKIFDSPKLRSEYNINEHWLSDYINQLKADSYKYGSYYWDLYNVTNNIGLIKDENGKNVPIIIDLEAASSIANPHPILKEMFFDKQQYDMEKLPNLPQTDTNYIAAQNAHVKGLGLEYGKIKGALNYDYIQKELEDFADKRKKQNKHTDYPTNPLWVDVVNSGVSKSEFGYEADKALQSRTNQGFCHDIRAKLEEKGAITNR